MCSILDGTSCAVSPWRDEVYFISGIAKGISLAGLRKVLRM